MDYYTRVEQATTFLRARMGEAPDVAVVLGSGLGDFADRLAEPERILYGEIPHWPASAVVGHEGRLVAGSLGRRRVLALAGRVHYYEGHAMEVVTFATRVLGRLGLKVLILTNAAGGINLEFEPGTLMVIDDHINLMGGNPLIGPNEERFGPRFPDMTEVYASRLRRLAAEVASERLVGVKHGVYAALHGPSYETPAEIRFLRTIGADAVGMSTAPEAIVARHMGLEVLGISCITNPAAGVLPTPLVHDEVMEVARRVRGQFSSLLEGIIERL
ncbi:purine nucleoside phosphorylase I, inosine and guanosine-specific [soil metagenome]|nr:purine-nucleoside phosphorylase [Acidobacteriota bacterium]